MEDVSVGLNKVTIVVVSAGLSETPLEDVSAGLNKASFEDVSGGLNKASLASRINMLKLEVFREKYQLG